MSIIKASKYEPKFIRIPNDLTTFEYHELLAFYRFKAEVNPAKIEYKYACDDICKMLDGKASC